MPRKQCLRCNNISNIHTQKNYCVSCENDFPGHKGPWALCATCQEHFRHKSTTRKNSLFYTCFECRKHKICKRCNNPFTVDNISSGTDKIKFCPDCLAQRTCEICEKPFTPKDRQIMREYDVCSHTCSKQYNRLKNGTLIIVYCAKCGTSKRIPPSRQYKRETNIKKDNFFCDINCRKKYEKANHLPHREQDEIYGDINYVESQKKKARKRDNHTCRSCGKRKPRFGRNFDVHHIKKARLFKDKKAASDLNNLITLCPQCHKKVEYGKIPCPTP